MALRRSSDRVLAGVCAGLAKEWDLNPTLVRVLYVVFTLTFLGLGIVVYLVLYVVMEDPVPPGAD
jgi:phage shock protein PspC (stress-responsive transcriptional regulator)